MSQKELYEHYRYSKHMMMNARNKVDRATWMVMFRWAVDQIRMTAAATTVIKVQE